MKRIIKLTENDIIPDGAKFIYAKTVKEKVDEEEDHFFFCTTV